MSYSISTLMIRNLRDVFGENDPARRRAAIDELYTEDCVFYDATKGIYRGRDEIERVAGAIKATHPDFRYQPCLLKNLATETLSAPGGLWLIASLVSPGQVHTVAICGVGLPLRNRTSRLIRPVTQRIGFYC